MVTCKSFGLTTQVFTEFFVIRLYYNIHEYVWSIMRRFYLSLLFGCSLGVYGQAFGQSGGDSSFVHSILQQHNAIRQELSLPDLKWSTDLVADAQAWANHLAKIDRGEHDQSIRGREGENLWWGTAGAFTSDQMVDGWATEKSGFVYGIFPDCKKSRSTVVGHYTQIIWKNTTSVGCALATNGKTDYLVCRYSPAGNIIGQKPY